MPETAAGAAVLVPYEMFTARRAGRSERPARVSALEHRPAPSPAAVAHRVRMLQHLRRSEARRKTGTL